MTQPQKLSLLRRSMRPVSVAWALAALAPLAQAQSLVELYASARVFDAVYQSARLQHDANLARADQTAAGVLPTAGLSAGASRVNVESTASPAGGGTRFNTRNATLSASQPLYRPGNWATYEQGFRQVDLARSQFEAAAQDLIVRTSQVYFDVLAAQDTLAFVRAQKEAVNEQLAFAKRNFEVGTSTITDTREAQARFDLVTAQEIAAENDLRVRKIALDQLVGISESQPRPLALPVRLPAVMPAEASHWVQQSELHNPAIRQARSNAEIADLEIKKAEAGHQPTLDATLSYNVTQNPSAAALAGVSSRASTGNVGLLLNVPLFAGFSTQNRIRETLALRDKALSDLEGTRRNVSQNVRTAYLGVQSGQSQVRALEAAELSSQSALDANRLGYQVGVRINIDVLNAQSQLFQTKRDLAQARYNVLLGGLRLRQASGTLTAEDLQQVNGLLAR